MSILAEPIWEDPPPEHVNKGTGGIRKIHWKDVLRPLSSSPNRWARIAEYGIIATAQVTAWQLTNGYCELPAGQYEFVYRGRFVYGRFLRG